MSSSSYRSILKSTSLIGGASVINILIGMVRIKFVAVLLGPSGVGLMGVYATITGMVGTLAGMGISTSGVRQIAYAYAKGDEQVVGRTVKTLRRTVWLTGLLGCFGMVAAAWPLSKATFGSGEETFNLALLGSTILFGSLAAGQGCLLQGTRRIKALAWVSIFGALNGTLISIPCYFFWGCRGIVPSLILSALAGVATSWWFARRIPVAPFAMPWRDSRNEAGQLLRFGFPIMLTGLFGALSTYAIRVVLIRQVGLEGVGVYQAAFGLSGILANFVLNAMGTDYYPRLTAVAHDPVRASEEINSQTEIALLLATPALAVTLIFAPLVILVFYSGQFDGAVEILRWAVFGIFGRVVSWPVGFLILAKGKGTLFLVSEMLSGLIHLALIWACTRLWGLQGTGIAFLLLYCFHTVFIYGLCTYLNRNLWNRATLFHVLGLGGMLVLIGAVLMSVTHDVIRWTLSLSACGALSGYCLVRLSARTGITLQTLKTKLLGA